MKFLLVATTLTFALTVAGATRCQRGGYYWCRSKSINSKTEVVAMEKNVGRNVQCKQCEELVRKMNRIRVDNLAKNEVKATLKEVCSTAFALSSTCNLLDTHFDKMWNLLVNKGLDSDAVCSKMELCSNSLMTKSWSPKITKIDWLQCFICSQAANQALKTMNGSILQEAAKDLAKKASVYLGDFADDWPVLIDIFGNKIYSSVVTAAGNKIKPALEIVCDFFPCNIAIRCSSIIDLGVDLLGNKISSGGEVCTSLGLCNSNLAATVKNRIKSMFTDDMCEICKITASFSNTQSKPELRYILGKVCKSLPGSLGRNCSSLEKKVDLVWDILKPEIESGEICDMLKVCKPYTHSVKFRPLKDNSNGLIQIVSIVNEIFEYYWYKIVNAVRIITFLFNNISTIFMEEMPDEIADMCNMFQVFQFSESVSFANTTKGITNAGICDGCKMAAISFKPYMDNKEEIISALKRVCKLLPFSINSYCYNQVNSNYFDLGWGILKQEIGSGGICDMLQECKFSTTHSLKMKKMQDLRGVLDTMVDFFKKIFVDIWSLFDEIFEQENDYAVVENDISSLLQLNH